MPILEDVVEDWFNIEEKKSREEPIQYFLLLIWLSRKLVQNPILLFAFRYNAVFPVRVQKDIC